MDIQNLLSQQAQIQTQYNQLVAQLQANPNLPIDQIESIKAQLNSLNATYLNIQQQLKNLGYNQPTVNKDVQIKQWARFNFSFKKLSIWCGVLLVIIAGLFTLTISSLINNPNALIWVGIDANSAKNLISIFAWLIFWTVWLIWLGFLISNIYRLITVKNQSKLKYILSLLWAFLGLWIVGGLWGLTFIQIWKINVEIHTSNRIVNPYLIWKNWTKVFWWDAKAIAPWEVAFELNSTALSSYTKNLWDVSLQSITISCGNPQKQTITYSNWVFNWNCFYDKKWEYQISSLITYTNNITKEQNITDTQTIGSLTFPAEIQVFLSSKNQKSKTPISASAQNPSELNLGKAPAKITIDTTTVFRDYKLNNYLVSRDMDENETIDRQDMTIFDFTYNLPKVYRPTVKFPELWDFVYSFPIRVEPSDVPICEVQLLNFEKTRYKIQINILDWATSSISSYSYNILNTSTNQTVQTNKSSTRERDYTFPEVGSYLVYVDFITIDGKKWACESEILNFAKETITTDYTFSPTSASSVLDYWTYTLTSIPQTVKLTLSNITPNSSSVNKNVFLDDEPILNESNTDIYPFLISDSNNHEIKITLSDPEKSLSNEIIIPIKVQLANLEWKLIAEPDKWYTPLTVKFNASQIKSNIPNDEIIYYSRDFGDWETKENLTQAIIEHKYAYDNSTENWRFNPKVTIWTRQGFTGEFSLDLPIIVSKPIIEINLDSPSHPTKTAKSNTPVSFLAEFNWLPEVWNRDFGDWTQPIQCRWRACSEIQHAFSNVGNYTIKLSLSMEDSQTVEKTMQFQVN